MRKIEIKIFRESKQLINLRDSLCRMGFVAELYSDLKSFRSSILSSTPDLMLIEKSLTSGKLRNKIFEELPKDTPTLLVEINSGRFLFTDHQNIHQFNLIDLHDYILNNLIDYSRRNLRLEVNLPTIMENEKNCHVTKVSTLSIAGAFVKTVYSNPDIGESLKLTISLLGHNIELDVTGHVAYHVTPCAENNYIQGVGVHFEQEDIEKTRLLNNYLFSCIEQESMYSFATNMKNVLRTTITRPVSKRARTVPKLR